MICEYTDRKECQRMRTLYEMKDVNVLMITERALVFQKIMIRFARNLIMYSIPESPDILEQSMIEIMDNQGGWDMILKHRLNLLRQKTKNGGRDDDDKMDTEQFEKSCREVIREGRTYNSQKSIVGLFSQFDGIVLERMVGTENYKQLINNLSKDAFDFN